MVSIIYSNDNCGDKGVDHIRLHNSESNMTTEKIQPFDSFYIVYKVLVWAGYFKLSNKHYNRFTLICHQIYRPLTFLFIFVFNLQHITFIVQSREHMEDVFDALMIAVPQMNLLVKYLTMNLQIPRIVKINDLINDPVFAAKSKKDEKLLLNNTRAVHRMTKVILINVTIATLFWPTSYFVRRYQDQTSSVPSYVPFDTDTWGKFTLSVALEVAPILWVGYGHLALDCVVSTYFSQAAVQLKIIKHNLEHLFDTDSEDTIASGKSYPYKDVKDTDMKDRFVCYVQRFEKVAWYTKEVNDVFNPAMTFQFFTSSLSICMVVYKMSSTPVGSVPFVFLIVLILMFSTQVFLYCYFGNLVQYESESVVNSLYLSDWLSVSPKFRRLLLIAMLRWSHALTPAVSGIIPLSLNTFVSILRSAYSLYAVLGTRKL